MTDLDRIMNIRKRRAERAGTERAKQIKACNTARERVLEAHEAAQAFSKEIQFLETDLLNDLMNKPVTQNDINEMRSQLQHAEAHSERLASRMRDSREALRFRERCVEAARAAKGRAERKLTKIEELNRATKLVRSHEMQAAEDAEIDEFSNTLQQFTRPGLT